MQPCVAMGVHTCQGAANWRTVVCVAIDPFGTTVPRCYALIPPLLLALSLFSATAHAQVQRCTDARTGQVTYTDEPCPSGQRAAVVVPALSAEEQAAQQQQYEQAQQRLQEELARSQAARAAQAQAEAAQAAARAALRPPPAPVVVVPQQEQTPSYGVLPYPVYVDRPHPRLPHPTHRPPHGKPQPPTQPGPGWYCNVFRCSDGKGNVIPRP